jgi:hypothetical protein
MLRNVGNTLLPNDKMLVIYSDFVRCVICNVIGLVAIDSCLQQMSIVISAVFKQQTTHLENLYHIGLYLSTLVLTHVSHLQVSQQVNYAKSMFEERRYTVISTGDSILED